MKMRVKPLMNTWGLILLFMGMIGLSSCALNEASGAAVGITDNQPAATAVTPTAFAWIPMMVSEGIATPIITGTVTAMFVTPTPPATMTQEPPTGVLFATHETAPILHQGDAADDPAIWIHPTDPALSVIIGTDKNGGLALYDLEGKELQYLPDGQMNNVDLRDGFPLGDQQITLVTAGNRTDNSIAVYKGNPDSRQLENVASQTLYVTNLSQTYGSCMYVSASTGKYYVIINDKNGRVEQWELFDNGSGLVDATLVRTIEVGSQTEGCVADDELGFLYIGEENVGIWKYGAEPDSGGQRLFVDATGAGGHLVADVEGLTIFYGVDGKGFLIASSQGNDAYNVYRREETNDYLTTFTIGAGNGIDAVTGTDGIDVTHKYLGPLFPEGLFVAHDGANDDGNQNYKLVPWSTLAKAFIETFMD